MNITQEAYKKTVIPEEGYLLTDGTDVFKSLICPKNLTDEVIKGKYREVKEDEFIITDKGKLYSGYKIIETLKAHNLWDTYRRKLQQADVYELFMKANVIKEDNPYFIKFIKTVPNDVKILLDDCIAEPYY